MSELNVLFQEVVVVLWPAGAPAVFVRIALPQLRIIIKRKAKGKRKKR